MLHFLGQSEGINEKLKIFEAKHMVLGEAK